MKPVIAVPAIAALVYRSYSKKSLTPAGTLAALLTAIAHAVHPWNLPFVLLAVFFLAGTRATHVKKQAKARLTMSATGRSADAGEGPRTHVQVFANSLVASIFTLMHAYQLHLRKNTITDVYNSGIPSDYADVGSLCYAWGGDLLVVGIIANYACVAADTFSSELGILSSETPRLITSLTLRKVPRGTNGGVTLGGLGAGLLGSMIVVTAAMVFLPMCSTETSRIVLGGRAATQAAAEAAVWSVSERRLLMIGLTLWGLLGSVADSVLGGLFQRSVRDVRSGKIVEGEGGTRIILQEPPHAHPHVESTEPAGSAESATESAAEEKTRETSSTDRFDVHTKHRRPSFGDEKPSRAVENGWDLLDNNDVNLLMAFGMSVGAMGVASWYWGVPMNSIMKP